MADHNLTVDECLALLRDPSLKAESIAEEMECAGCGHHEPATVARARDALGKLQTEAVAQTAGLEGPDPRGVAAEIAALPPILALGLTHAAGRAGRQEVLRELATGADKTLAKEAKRELHKLRQKGVEVQELKPAGAPVLKPLAEAETPDCFASSVDSYGERAVWWARPAKQGVEVAQLVISDVKGILAADALGLSRRSWREFVKRLPRGGVVTNVVVPRDHARQLIAEAEAEGARNGFSPPPQYGDALRVLGPAPVAPPPSPGLLVDYGPDGELPHALAGAALFEDPLFITWIPEEDELRRFGLQVDEIATSQLYLDAAQKRVAFERAAEDHANGYFTPQRRSRYARRLLEMAHVLAQEGRMDAARTARAVAASLERDASNPFCRALFAHAARGRLDEAPAAPAPAAGGLITP